jgi:hypothetical protein
MDRNLSWASIIALGLAACGDLGKGHRSVAQEDDLSFLGGAGSAPERLLRKTSELCCSMISAIGQYGRACTRTTGKCTRNADCCSGLCAGGFCEYQCAKRGEACGPQRPCCSNRCLDGICEGGCAANWFVCSLSSSCCSGYCWKDPGVATGLCCVDTGGPCPMGGGECCSGTCDRGSGTCAEPR